jgi:hypothetical protein
MTTARSRRFGGGFGNRNTAKNNAFAEFQETFLLLFRLRCWEYNGMVK